MSSYEQLRADIPHDVKDAALGMAKKQSDPTVENVKALSRMWEVIYVEKLKLNGHEEFRRAWMESQ